MSVPNSPTVRQTMQAALEIHQAGKLAEAAALYEQVLALQPDYAEAHYALGNAHYGLGRPDAARQCYERAIAHDPGLYIAHYNLGNIHRQHGRLDQAVDCYRETLAIRPDYAAAQTNLALALIAQGRPDEAVAYLQIPGADGREVGYEPPEAEFADVDSPRLFALNYLSIEPSDLFAAHRRFAERFETPLKKRGQIYFLPTHDPSGKKGTDLFSSAENRSVPFFESVPFFQGPSGKGQQKINLSPFFRDPERRLRLGYVSPDFRHHGVTRFIEPLLTRHDRDQFEVFAYDCRAASGAAGEHIAASVDHWLPCAALSNDALAARIVADGIDVLVDLAGHTKGNRLLTFARKPAPVQVTWLGYPTTTGLAAMDYRLTTAEVDPEGADDFYTERLYRLPRTLWCYRPAPDVPAAGEAPAHRAGFVTFGSMNNFSKISPATLSLWVELLREVPDSRLLMTGVPEGSARDRLRERFAARGVGGDRLILFSRLPAAQFRELIHRHVDIALDPFPYNGTTTTCEALWMGLPVVSLKGRTAVSRSGHALLETVGLGELCAEHEAQYIGIAVKLAGDLAWLDGLRLGMRARLEASPLRDEAGFTRDVESAYRAMWQAWCV